MSLLSVKQAATYSFLVFPRTHFSDILELITTLHNLQNWELVLNKVRKLLQILKLTIVISSGSSKWIIVLKM